MTGAEASRKGDVLKELRVLVAEGIRPTLLGGCDELIRRVAPLARQLPNEKPEDVLGALLRLIIKRERMTEGTPNPYLRAAGEFIGVRDEGMADPPVKDYEANTAYRMRIIRGAYHVVVRGQRLSTYRNGKEHVGEACRVLLVEIDKCLAPGRHINGLVNDLKRDIVASRTVKAEPANTEQLPDENSKQDNTSSGFIRRPILEDRFNVLVKAGAKLIALVGLPGMGKSSLARALAPDLPFIEFQDGKPLLVDLRPALKDYGLGFDDLDEGNAWAKLTNLLIAEPGPKFVVLDNLHNTSELRDLVPRTTTPVVVATCRESGDRTPAHCTQVLVGKMKQDEALCLLKMRLPSLNDEDAAFAARTLGYYPLVIHVACGYVNTSGVSLRTLCSSLQVEPGDVRTEGGEKIREILERTVLLLRERNPIAVELLAFVVSDLRPIAPTSKGLLALTCELYGFDVGPHKYADAMQELTGFFLVELGYLLTEEQTQHMYGEMSDDDARALRGPSRVQIHSLLRSALSSLLEGDVTRIDAMANQCRERLMDIRQRMLENLEAYDSSLETRIIDIDNLLNVIPPGDFYLEIGKSGGQCVPAG